MPSKRKLNARTAEGERALEPILVDYFGRDGSTLVMRLLATSPQIAVASKYPYEQRYFAYLYRWARLLGRRQWPRDFWTGHHLGSLTQEKSTPFLGPPPWLPRDLLEPEQGGEDISSYCFRTVWAEFSRRAAAHTREHHGVPDAEVRYYAEKHLNTWMVKLDDLPSVQLVALLRDPRDTYVSIEAFRRKRHDAGQAGIRMGRHAGETDEAWLARFLRRQRGRLWWIDQAMKQGTVLVLRYEDLVLDLPRQAGRIEDWLGVRVEAEAVAKDDRLRTSHVSADTPESSIGRWRRELPSELARRLNDELGDELRALGFEVPEPQPSRPRPAAVAAGASGDNRVETDRALEASDDQQELREALNTANEDRVRLRAALDAAAIERAELQRELNATVRWLRRLERSRTWRITRPIRAAGAAFRRRALSIGRGRRT